MSTDGGGIEWHIRWFRSITIFISQPFCKVNRFACRGSFGTTNLWPSIVYYISARLSIEITKISVIFLIFLNLSHPFNLYPMDSVSCYYILYPYLQILKSVSCEFSIIHSLPQPFPARRRLPTYVTYIIFRIYSPTAPRAAHCPHRRILTIDNWFKPIRDRRGRLTAFTILSEHRSSEFHHNRIHAAQAPWFRQHHPWQELAQRSYRHQSRPLYSTSYTVPLMRKWRRQARMWKGTSCSGIRFLHWDYESQNMSDFIIPHWGHPAVVYNAYTAPPVLQRFSRLRRCSLSAGTPPL